MNQDLYSYSIRPMIWDDKNRCEYAGRYYHIGPVTWDKNLYLSSWKKESYGDDDWVTQKCESIEDGKGMAWSGILKFLEPYIEKRP